jgi:hypothetical protein
MSGNDTFLFVNDDTEGKIKVLNMFDITVAVPNGEYVYNASGNSLYVSDDCVYIPVRQNEHALFILKNR